MIFLNELNSSPSAVSKPRKLFPASISAPCSTWFANSSISGAKSRYDCINCFICQSAFRKILELLISPSNSSNFFAWWTFYGSGRECQPPVLFYPLIVFQSFLPLLQLCIPQPSGHGFFPFSFPTTAFMWRTQAVTWYRKSMQEQKARAERLGTLFQRDIPLTIYGLIPQYCSSPSVLQCFPNSTSHSIPCSMW